MEGTAEPQKASRLLIVEDDVSQLQTLMAVMQAEGFDAIGCSTAAEALEHFDREDIAVAVVDLRLPDLDGTRLLEKLGALAHEVPIIINTGYSSYESARDAVNLGAFAYVEKAGDPDELVRHVHRAFRERLRRYAEALESAVAERTRELQETNEALSREIDERKRTEEALRESEEQYRLVSENVPVVVYSALPDEHSTNLFVSGRIQGLTGYAGQEFLDDPELFTAMVHPDDRTYVWDKIREHREHKAPLDVEYRIVTKDNAVKWIRDRATPSFDESGQITRLDGYMEDITERRRAEEALRASEEQYRALFEHVPVGLYRTTPDGRILAANPGLVRMLGYSSFAELASRNLAVEGFEPSSPRSAFMEAIERDGKIEGLEAIWTKRDGSPVVVRESAVAVRGGDGAVLYYEGTVEDITERKRAEEALRESEERYRRVTENIPVGLYRNTPGPEGRFLVANSALARMHGYESVEEFLPTAVADHHWDRHQREAFSEKLLASGEVVGEELELKKKDGTPFWAAVTARVVRDESGKALYFDGMLEDITERKRADEALRDSREQLRALAARVQSAREEERKQAAREIHDELGQALTGLRFDLSWLAGQASEARPGTKRRLVLDRTRSMLGSVDATLQAVRRITSALRPAVLDDLGLIAAIEWQATDFQKRTGIRCDLSSALEDIDLAPDCATALFRIFQEALTNVARHAEARRVRAALKVDGGRFRMWIADDGKGISEAAISDHKSFGLLGMRERAAAFGGTIEITGRRGQGTTVTVRVPLHETGHGEIP